MSAKKPNREEQLVLDCLSYQGFSELVFEPDGNIPPDVLLNGSTAIEVRRLNQNIPTESGFEGLEQTEYSVHGMLRSIMDKFPIQPSVNGAFVGYHIKRPLPPLKELKKEVELILTAHQSIIEQSKKYNVGYNFELEVFPAPKKLDKLYKYGMSSDNDSGGFIIGLIHENLKLIIEEKERKISQYQDKYPKWWLALVDNVSYVMDDFNKNQFYELPRLETKFSRILMVSPLEHTRFTYLYE